jgi:hypothetical protein
MSWTQVYVSGMAIDATVKSVEATLAPVLVVSDSSWVGEGSTVVKCSQTHNTVYCFLAFLTLEGAAAAIDRIHNNFLDLGWDAELAQPKPKKMPRKETDCTTEKCVRLRRKRAPPAPKHPVLKSSAPAKNKSGPT